MSERSKQEPFLLGFVAAAVATIGIILPLLLLSVFGGEDPGSTTAQTAPTPTTTAVTQGNATAGPPEGRGPGRGGPPEGRGPGSGNDSGEFDPTSEGVASAEVTAAFGKGGCTACHTVKGIGGGTATIGPNLSRIGAIASDRRPGTSVEAYIEESIVSPNAFIMPNCPNGPCPSGAMPQTFADTLSESDISTIVNYLAALGTDAEAGVLGAPAG